MSHEDGSALVFLRTCHDNAEASMLRSVLESQGIYCVIQGEMHRSMLGAIGGYVELRLLVPADQAEEAERVLAACEPAPPPAPVPEAVPQRLGAGYREIYPPPATVEGAEPLVWRPVHTWLAALGILLVLALALAVALGER